MSPAGQLSKDAGMQEPGYKLSGVLMWFFDVQGIPQLVSIWPHQHQVDEKCES